MGAAGGELDDVGDHVADEGVRLPPRFGHLVIAMDSRDELGTEAMPGAARHGVETVCLDKDTLSCKTGLWQLRGTGLRTHPDIGP
ncbi:hypothetical protein BU204_10185 [Actinophytocola xanthii]|uniref:Uncharacterized protein n=1 Tax=Actinophytocola xanthii TaxID=1912961 RepID=A0A1Q8CT93_9PSEU|nr:hypothetical protein BU204_10185 [Actinophytocola xanthii]